MKVFDLLYIGKDNAFLDGKPIRAVLGKHCLWLPEKEAKVILSFNGAVESNEWYLGRNIKEIKDFTFNTSDTLSDPSLRSVLAEVAILKELSAQNMSPVPGEIFYIKNVISSIFTTAKHCDPQGMYGYYIPDASKLPPGKYSFGKFKELFIDSGKIMASPGALGDLEKKEGNLVNGYLVDVRRTIWDMMSMCWPGSKLPWPYDVDSIRYIEDKDALQKKIFHGSQFPHKDRKQNYQTYYMDGEYIQGTRNTLYRFDVMKIDKNLARKTVLDLGCQLGSMGVEAYLRGARKVTGLEYEADYVDCARNLARYNKMLINFMQYDLTDINSVDKYVNEYYPEPIDIVFALSLSKHIGAETLFKLLRTLKFKICYIESHNTGTAGLSSPHVQELLKHINKYKSEYLGMTEDRSPRCVWRLDG